MDKQLDTDSDLLWDDYPKLTPGRIHYGNLFAILEWEQRNGVATTTKSTIEAMQEEGYSAAQTGLELGLIDYPQATGCEE
jgi:hypothetical protein